MKLSPTLSRYVGRRYVLHLLFITFILLGIIYLFDTVELLRRASKRDDVPFSLVLTMGLYKLPDMGQLILPFAILFSAMFTFWQLNRRHELIVVRSAGFSAWQFLAPVVGIALFIGALQITVINPVSAALLSRFETLESRHLSERRSYVTLLREGLWLRQGMDDGSHIILHAGRIDMPLWVLHDVMVLFFSPDDGFIRRIDSPTARIESGQWRFEDALSNRPETKPERLPLVTLPTELTAEDIEDSFSSPKALSFWNMPGFIKTMESTGFDATRVKIHFESLLAQPLMFAAMILLAAAVSLRPPRNHGTLILILLGVGIGLMVFFLSSFLQALGASHQIPALLASWSPPLVALLLGVAIMLNLEDG